MHNLVQLSMRQWLSGSHVETRPVEASQLSLSGAELLVP